MNNTVCRQRDYSACIDRGLKRHEKTGSALNVSAGNSPKMIHKMKGENRQMEYEFMTADTPLPPCMPFPKALAGLPISSTAKVMYCKMLDAMLTKKLEDENGILFVYFPIKQLAAALSWCEMTVKRSLDELENAGRKAEGICGAKPHIHSHTENIIRYSQKWLIDV